MGKPCSFHSFSFTASSNLLEIHTDYHPTHSFFLNPHCRLPAYSSPPVVPRHESKHHYRRPNPDRGTSQRHHRLARIAPYKDQTSKTSKQQYELGTNFEFSIPFQALTLRQMLKRSHRYICRGAPDSTHSHSHSHCRHWARTRVRTRLRACAPVWAEYVKHQTIYRMTKKQSVGGEVRSALA